MINMNKKHCTVVTLLKAWNYTGLVSASKACKLAIDKLPSDGIVTHTSILSISKEYYDGFKSIISDFLESSEGKKHTEKLKCKSTFHDNPDFLIALQHAESLSGFAQCEYLENMLYTFKIPAPALSQKVRADVARRGFTFYTPYKTDLAPTSANRDMLNLQNRQYDFIVKKNNFYYCKKK